MKSRSTFLCTKLSKRFPRSTLCTLFLAATAWLYAPLLEASDLAPLGRLLTTPVQRAKLDELRKNTGKAIPHLSNNNEDEIIVPQRKIQAEPTPAPNNAPAPIQFNGYVKRSDGSETTWLNQVALTSPTSLTSPINAKSHAGQLQLTLPTGKQVRLKPGQSVLPKEAEVTDELADGYVTVNRPNDKSKQAHSTTSTR